MNWEYLHLISHSFPIVLSATGAAVGLIGWMADREALEKWGLVAFLVGGIFVIPAYVTGLAAADVVADRTFVRPSVIQRHRTWATIAAVPLVVAAILAGFAFAEPEDRRLRRFVILVGALAAAVTGFAASLGARIEHGPEPEAPAVEAVDVPAAVPPPADLPTADLDRAPDRRLDRDASRRAVTRFVPRSTIAPATSSATRLPPADAPGGG